MIINGHPEWVHIGKTDQIALTVLMVAASGHIYIGDHCIIAEHARVLCGYHDYTLKMEARYPCSKEGCDIHIGNGVWICVGAIIVGPVSIGDNAVIGAGSVVTHDVPANQVWAGNPAKFIKEIAFK
jgi:maltose O-acetyltransferase